MPVICITTTDVQGTSTPTFDAALSAYRGNAPFELIATNTSRIYHLTVLNNTLLPRGDDKLRRYGELYGQIYTSIGCADGTTANAGGPVPPLPAGGLSSCAQPVVWHTTAVYDWRYYSQIAAMLSILRTLFLVLLLALAAFLFDRDNRRLVLEPIKRMMKRLDDLVTNPFSLAAGVQMAAGAGGGCGALGGGGAAGALSRPLSRSSSLSGGGKQHRQAPQYLLNCKANGLTTGDADCDADFASDEAATDTWAAPRARRRHQPRDLERADSLDGSMSGELGPRGSNPRARAASAPALAAVCTRCADALRAAAGWTWRALRRAAVALFAAASFVVRRRRVEEDVDSYETRALENSVQKIGQLLAVGFGDAGAQIIADNIKNSGDQDLNPMVPGKPVVSAVLSVIWVGCFGSSSWDVSD